MASRELDSKRLIVFLPITQHITWFDGESQDCYQTDAAFPRRQGRHVSDKLSDKLSDTE